MIPIKLINGTKYNLKSIDELTTAEYIEVNRIDNLDKLKFIEWQTKEKYEIVFLSKISETVLNLIGEFPDIDKLKPPKKLLGRFVKRYEIESIGQRFMIETTKKHKGFDLLVFIVAVAFTNSPNLDEIENMMQQLYKLPFKDVLPTGYFFFLRLKNGRSTGMNFLSKIKLLMKMKFSRKGQGSKN